MGAFSLHISDQTKMNVNEKPPPPLPRLCNRSEKSKCPSQATLKARRGAAPHA